MRFSNNLAGLTLALAAGLAVMSCGYAKLTPQAYAKRRNHETELSKRYYFNAWCSIEISAKPLRADWIASGEALEGRKAQLNSTDVTRAWNFFIRIRNTRDAVGPLRYISTNLEEYQKLYGYLLTEAKGDFMLRCGEQIIHPTLYWYTNNYNSIPMDEIKVGFTNLPQASSESIELLYIDRIFLRDTLVYALNARDLNREQNTQLLLK